MMKPTYYDAVLDLVGGRISGESDGPLNTFLFIDEQPPPTEEEVQTRLASMTSDWDAQTYARNRKDEYPDLEEQLDYIYHNGVTKWKSDMIKPVKDKYPKG